MIITYLFQNLLSDVAWFFTILCGRQSNSRNLLQLYLSMQVTSYRFILTKQNQTSSSDDWQHYNLALLAFGSGELIK